jgi:hypothetical protein
MRLLLTTWDIRRSDIIRPIVRRHARLQDAQMIDTDPNSLTVQRNEV